ncbi:hypothetical protein [Parafrankia soli]|uniref:hypothetical protein n=1 Tax=Parafrankia soli TaxID=2599596 RepID=UPI0008D8F0DF|nr:hypothetical protein [Parafrankia soli]
MHKITTIDQIAIGDVFAVLPDGVFVDGQTVPAVELSDALAPGSGHDLAFHRKVCANPPEITGKRRRKVTVIVREDDGGGAVPAGFLWQMHTDADQPILIIGHTGDTAARITGDPELLRTAHRMADPLEMWPGDPFPRAE